MVHDAWRYVHYVFGNREGKIEVVSHGRLGTRCYELNETSLARESAVWPPIRTLTLRIRVGAWCAKHIAPTVEVKARRNGMYVTVWDIMIVLLAYFDEDALSPYTVRETFPNSLEEGFMTNLGLQGGHIHFKGIRWITGRIFEVKCSS